MPRYLHATLLLGLALCLLLGWAELYRAAQYINLLFLFYLLAKRPQIDKDLLWFLIAPATVLLLLHIGATLNAEVAKPIRHFWIASAIAVSIAMMDKDNQNYVRRVLPWLIPLFAAAYLFLQLLFLFYFDAPFAATENPHHLAYYCGLLLILLLWVFNKQTTVVRLVTSLQSVMLLALVAYSQSGAAALALLVATLVAAALNCRKLFPQRWTASHWIALVGLAIAGLVMLGLGGLESIKQGWHILFDTAGKDQRIGLWQDAWRMQQDASPLQWLIGHGAQSFVVNFTEYSRFHGTADFHSPHSSTLEMLYAYGIVGVLALLMAYFTILRSVSRGLREEPNNPNDTGRRSAYRLIAVVLAYNYVLISLTMPLYVHFNLYTVAYCCGSLYLLNAHNKNAPLKQ